MASESWVEFYRKQTLRQSLVCRMFIKGALGIHTCGRELKEAGCAHIDILNLGASGEVLLGDHRPRFWADQACISLQHRLWF